MGQSDSIPAPPLGGTTRARPRNARTALLEKAGIGCQTSAKWRERDWASPKRVRTISSQLGVGWRVRVCRLGAVISLDCFFSAIRLKAVKAGLKLLIIWLLVGSTLSRRQVVVRARAVA